MRATILLLSAAFTLSSTAAFAQSSYNHVVQPLSEPVQAIMSAPIEYDETGIVKAQHFNADHLTDEEYQAIRDEADRIRAYRSSNGLNFENDYVETSATQTYSAPVEYIQNDYTYSAPAPATDVNSAPSYQLELFAPQATTVAASTTSASQMHTVSKGDTLYNIAKRYNTSVPAIQAENGLSGSNLSLGQRVFIPGTRVETISSAPQALFVNAPTPQSYVTRVTEPAPYIETPQVEYVNSSEAVYAVLPKDTLYSISRRTCVPVSDIISRNAIANANVLTPGDRLTLPGGHCLYN